MSQRAERELDRLLHIARPEVSRDFTDDVMSRIAAADDPMPIAPAIIFPFRGRRFPSAPPMSLFARTAAVTAPLVAMLALVFVLATTLFTDKGTERRHNPDEAALLPGGEPASELVEKIKALGERIATHRTALNAIDPHVDAADKRRCSTCHQVTGLASVTIPNIVMPEPDGNDRVEVVAFVDLEAPSAPAMMQAIETMALKFSNQVSIEIRNPHAASPAARASLAAAQQGAYWPMVECLTERGTDRAGIEACADDAKLDRATLERQMSSPTITAAIDADRERARVAGVTDPAIVIGGRVFTGPAAHVDARSYINAALAHRTL